MLRKNKSKKPAKTIEQKHADLGRQLEALYDSVDISKGAFYRIALLKGIMTGVGGVIGATVVIALLIWVLSLFDNVPLVGDFVDAISRTIEGGSPTL